MTTHRDHLIVTIAALGIYGVAAFAPLAVQGYFWTSSAMGSDVPWYFMGQDLLGGAAAALGLFLVAVLAAWALRNHGPAVLGALPPVLLFLSTAIGRGVAVLLHTRHIWKGPPAAESDWQSFAEYSSATNVAQYVALGTATVFVFGVLFLGRRSSACREAPETPAASP